ncbi:hypothetical protein A3H38_05240 [candidate division WOR-1 bacterium RIFCSPLOWO2_02_FULL_46_20]|uniref:Succinate dehydrogenase, cytochrome b556 subunit n=1 Tax=candidate division WOR-1 bacterium RIFCSPLOWO2_02_FULL_46_20 TaxID=1802567 RepID=A0A1F4RDS8_UNCSA|nr:MAG: hypothetical protein A3H38_05240 [candidate division WOR-1 bacterium RIFCSPLOWO2_02_FULL_46_20]
MKAGWLWFLQRVTAALIVIILYSHIFRVHYVELGQPILFAGVALRLKDLLILLTDSSLLLLALFHGLNGVRAVLLDYEFFTKHEKRISWSLLIIGIIFFFGGVKGLWAFLIIK